MTTRRKFIAGALASAAVVPQSPAIANVARTYIDSQMLASRPGGLAGPFQRLFIVTGPRTVMWSDNEALWAWQPTESVTTTPLHTG